MYIELEKKHISLLEEEGFVLISSYMARKQKHITTTESFLISVVHHTYDSQGLNVFYGHDSNNDLREHIIEFVLSKVCPDENMDTLNSIEEIYDFIRSLTAIYQVGIRGVANFEISNNSDQIIITLNRFDNNKHKLIINKQ